MATYNLDQTDLKAALTPSIDPAIQQQIIDYLINAGVGYTNPDDGTAIPVQTGGAIGTVSIGWPIQKYGFFGVLIEHFAGAFPLWLAPEQARVLTVSDKSEEYGRNVERQFREAGFRTSGDYRGQKLGAKIREAQLELIPYMLVVGEKDAAAGTVTVRDRLEGDLGAMPLAAAVAKLQSEITAKTVRQVAAASAPAAIDRGAQNEY